MIKKLPHGVSKLGVTVTWFYDISEQMKLVVSEICSRFYFYYYEEPLSDHHSRYHFWAHTNDHASITFELGRLMHEYVLRGKGRNVKTSFALRKARLAEMEQWSVRVCDDLAHGQNKTLPQFLQCVLFGKHSSKGVTSIWKGYSKMEIDVRISSQLMRSFELFVIFELLESYRLLYGIREYPDANPWGNGATFVFWAPEKDHAMITYTMGVLIESKIYGRKTRSTIHRNPPEFPECVQLDTKLARNEIRLSERGLYK